MGKKKRGGAKVEKHIPISIVSFHALPPLVRTGPLLKKYMY
jgi:hypothetical protein